jgi:hypoxanthine phosphoribosyltransferase
MTMTYTPDLQHELLNHINPVLFDRIQINNRVLQIGEQITADYAGRDLVLICILKGGVIFTSDLSRAISVPHQLEFVGSSSYKGGTRSSGGVRITKDVDQSLEGKDLLLIEDIYDTGNTLHVIHELLQLHRPASIEICALLHKKKNHLHQLNLTYTGFEIEDQFVVGYGLDFQEHYRNLPCIGVLKPEIYS